MPVLGAVYHQVAPRVTHAAYLPVNAVNLLTHTVIATAIAASGLITLGKSEIAKKYFREISGDLDKEIRFIYLHLLGTLNPSAVNKIDVSQFSASVWTSTAPLAATRIVNYLTSPLLRPGVDWQQRVMDDLNKRTNWFNRHVTARVAAPATAVAMLSGAIALMSLGAIAALFSIICLGLNKDCNQIAVANLAQVGFIFNQLYNGALGIIRPDLLSQRRPDLPSQRR